MGCRLRATIGLNIGLPGQIAIITPLSFVTKLAIYLKSCRCEVCTTINEVSAILVEELIENFHPKLDGKIKKEMHHFVGMMLMIMVV